MKRLTASLIVGVIAAALLPLASPALAQESPKPNVKNICAKVKPVSKQSICFSNNQVRWFTLATNSGKEAVALFEAFEASISPERPEGDPALMAQGEQLAAQSSQALANGNAFAAWAKAAKRPKS